MRWNGPILTVFCIESMREGLCSTTFSMKPTKTTKFEFILQRHILREPFKVVDDDSDCPLLVFVSHIWRENTFVFCHLSLFPLFGYCPFIMMTECVLSIYSIYYLCCLCFVVYVHCPPRYNTFYFVYCDCFPLKSGVAS